MEYSRFDHMVRKAIPSVGKWSYNPIAKSVADAIDNILSLPFSEFRELPPNHLRLRIGVGNRVFANHAQFLEMGNGTWLDFLSKRYCHSTSDIIELGCGCGRIARPLKGAWFHGTYVGVDIDEEMIHFCRKNFPQDRFRFVLSPHSSATYSAKRNTATSANSARAKLDIADADSGDFIFSISLFSHLLEPELMQYLRESARILRSNGLMHLTFFCIEHVRLGERWTFTHRVGNAYIENEALPEAAVAYHENYLKHLVEEAGFNEISVSPGDVQSVLVARKV
jgi:SAM-dependent methyltransferase